MHRHLSLAITVVLLSCGSPGGGSGTTEDTSADASADAMDVQGATDANSDATARLPPPDLLWDPGADTPALPPWIIDNLAPHGLSTWSFALEHAGEIPEHMHLADYAVGNGHVFSLIGHAVPFNTFHSMIGPDYQKDEGYFSDLWVEVAGAPDGIAFSWKREWIGRAQRAPVVTTHAEGALVAVSTLDVAPAGVGASGPARFGILRVVFIRNLSGGALDGLWVRVACARPQEDLGDGRVQEERGGNLRRLSWLDGSGPIAGAASLSIPVGPLPAGASVMLRLAAATGEEGDDLEATLAALDGSPEVLLGATLAAWDERLDRGVRILTPDPRVNDYFTGAQVIVHSQIAATGAICPMSQYTRTWLRDCGGPVRYLSRSGFFAEARGIIDYLWLGALWEGGLRNSYPADLDGALLDVLDPPDWATLPVMSGRTRAESPSYIPLMYGWYTAASGDGAVVEGRLPMLEHALMEQEFREDLLPFSGDETFRTAMAIAHGLPVAESFEEGYLSSNSSFLWVAAARVLGDLALDAGEVDLSEALETRLSIVTQAAEETYLQSDGSYTPYVTEDDLTPAPAPYEDVNTKPIWSGYLSRFDAAADDNLDGTIAALGGEDGILVSPLPDAYVGWMGLPIAKGIYTGMSPGYFLQNVASERHPVAEAAFNALQHHAAPGGATPEYAVLDGPFPLQLMYEPSGAEPADYTARYRPWEGAIVADAAMEYLFGIRQDAAGSRLGLSPSLPNGWSWSEARGVRVGETRIDLRVERIDGVWELRITHVEGPALEIELDLLWPDDGGDAVVTLDGDPLQSDGRVNRWAAGVLAVDSFLVEPGTLRVLKARQNAWEK
ncbi:MAG: hypothetical protein ABIK09_07250 [Pseudomonadota bacterium]